MRFLHLSDLHFHRAASDNAAAVATLATVRERYPLHAIIVTGDLTDDGDAAQLRNAFDELSRFPRLFFCPGNHDFGAAGAFYDPQRARAFDAALSTPLHQGGTFAQLSFPVVNVVREGADEVMLIALDTNLETVQPFDFACGEVGQPQLEALDQLLSAGSSAGKKKILFFHHHPFVRNNPFIELRDARALMRVVYGRVDVMAFGHRHVSQQWQGLCGIPYVLAADNAPGKAVAREIEVLAGAVTVRDVPIG